MATYGVNTCCLEGMEKGLARRCQGAGEISTIIFCHDMMRRSGTVFEDDDIASLECQRAFVKFQALLRDDMILGHGTGAHDGKTTNGGDYKFQHFSVSQIFKFYVSSSLLYDRWQSNTSFVRLHLIDELGAVYSAFKGPWHISVAGETCRLDLQMSGNQKSRAATTFECATPMLVNIPSWTMHDKNLLLKSAGSLVATLYPTGPSRFDGETAYSQSISLTKP